MTLYLDDSKFKIGSDGKIVQKGNEDGMSRFDTEDGKRIERIGPSSSKTKSQGKAPITVREIDLEEETPQELRKMISMSPTKEKHD